VHPDDGPAPADLAQPAGAQVALAAGQDRVDDHRVAVVADPGELVPHDQGRHPEAGMAGAVQLAAADPGRPHVHQDVALGHVRFRHVELLHRARTGEHQRLHG
jgi:hypothetical protein